VLVSFLALAAIVIGVKAAGHQAGWGMQFGSPIFIVCLTTLVTLVALNLFGVFEVTLGGKTLDAAGELASKHGAPGAFFNGVLATDAWRRPAPRRFLRRARLRFRAKRAVIVLIFLTVGLGLARLCFVELESGVAEISAEARRVDGKIQNRDGFPDAGDRGVAVQSRRR
jgi:hypothetical protein